MSDPGQADNDPRSFLLERLPNEAICAEIGVWQGDFSNQILEHTRPRALHLIDPWIYDPTYPMRWYGGSAAKSQEDMDAIYRFVAQRFSSCTNVFVHRMTSEAAARQFAHGHFDWVYIDANHSYDFVVQDLEAWLPKVAPGGLLAGDDVFWPGEDRSHPVKRALEGFVNAHRIDDVVVEQGQFKIRIPDAAL